MKHLTTPATKNTAKGGDAVKFGSINRDSFINAEIKRRLEPVGMIDELGQQQVKKLKVTTLCTLTE